MILLLLLQQEFLKFADPLQVNMNDEEWNNPHCIAAVLKSYLLELPTCLLTSEKYNTFIEAFEGRSSHILLKHSKVGRQTHFIEAFKRRLSDTFY